MYKNIGDFISSTGRVWLNGGGQHSDEGWGNFLRDMKKIDIKNKPSINGSPVKACQDYNKSNPPITVKNRGIEWISYKSGNLPNSFMSYFGTTLNVSSSGIYTIYMSADDQGTLYVNGKEIGSTNESESWHQLKVFKVKLNKEIYGIIVKVKNWCPKCSNTSFGINMPDRVHFMGDMVEYHNGCENPSSLAMFIEDPSDKIVLSTNTSSNWKASSSMIDYKKLPMITKARNEARDKILKEEEDKRKQVKETIDKWENRFKHGGIGIELGNEINITHGWNGWANKLKEEEDKVKENIKLKNDNINREENIKIPKFKESISSNISNGTCINLSSGIGCNNNKKDINIKSNIEKVAKVATLQLKKYVYKKGIGIVDHTPSILTSGESSISNNKIQIVKKEVSNTNIVKHESPIITSGKESYKEPDDLLHVENEHSNIKNKINNSGLLDVIKKYWWISLLAVGHII